MAIFLHFSPTSGHLHPLQVENCDSNSRLVVDEDDNGKLRLERVNQNITLYIHVLYFFVVDDFSLEFATTCTCMHIFFQVLTFLAMALKIKCRLILCLIAIKLTKLYKIKHELVGMDGSTHLIFVKTATHHTYHLVSQALKSKTTYCILDNYSISVLSASGID